MQPDLAEFQMRVGCDERALAGLEQLPPGDQLVAMDIVENQQCKNPSAVTWTAVRMCQREPARARMEYLHRHLDERATEAFGKLAPPVQEGICHQMDLTNVKNLSAFVFSLIRNNQKQPVHFNSAPQFHVAPVAHKVMQAPAYHQQPQPLLLGGYGRDRSRSPMGFDVAQRPHAQWDRHPVARHAETPVARYAVGASSSLDTFRMHFPIDDGAMRALQGLSAEDQFIACGLVEKQNPRNPSAVTWAMCKLVTNKPGQAKLEYIKHMIDADASAALDRLGPDELDALLMCELSRVRNVSAFVWSRIKAGINSAPQARPPARPPAKPPARPPAQLRSRQPTPTASKAPPSFEENDENILESVAHWNLNLDKRCQAALAELSHEEQMSILSSVDENVRNPSAYVWSKIRSMNKGLV